MLVDSAPNPPNPPPLRGPRGPAMEFVDAGAGGVCATTLADRNSASILVRIIIIVFMLLMRSVTTIIKVYTTSMLAERKPLSRLDSKRYTRLSACMGLKP